MFFYKVFNLESIHFEKIIENRLIGTTKQNIRIFEILKKQRIVLNKFR